MSFLPMKDISQILRHVRATIARVVHKFRSKLTSIQDLCLDSTPQIEAIAHTLHVHRNVLRAKQTIAIPLMCVCVYC